LAGNLVAEQTLLLFSLHSYGRGDLVGKGKIKTGG